MTHSLTCYPWVGVITVAAGQRLSIDGVECVVTSVDPDGITTRPLTDAD